MVSFPCIDLCWLVRYGMWDFWQSLAAYSCQKVDWIGVVLFLGEKTFFWERLTTINHRINRYTDKDFTVGNFERVPNQVTYLYHKGITYRAPYGSNQVTYRDRYTETAPGGWTLPPHSSSTSTLFLVIHKK